MKTQRLCKLVTNSKSFESFVKEAVKNSAWYLRPYVELGHKVDRPWIEAFYKAHKVKEAVL